MNVAPLDFEKPIAELEERLRELREHADGQELSVGPEVKKIEQKIASLPKEIYENLETATDRCEDVANIIEGVVLEHA